MSLIHDLHQKKRQTNAAIKDMFPGVLPKISRAKVSKGLDGTSFDYSKNSMSVVKGGGRFYTHQRRQSNGSTINSQLGSIDNDLSRLSVSQAERSPKHTPYC